MAVVQRSVVIAVPVEQAFDFVAHWRNVEKFYEGISDYRPATDKTRGDGVRFTCRVGNPVVGGIPYEVEFSDFVEHVGWTVTAVRGPKVVEHWRFERLEGGAGETRVTYDLSYEVPVPLVGRLIGALLSQPLWARRVERSLQNLKALLEDQDG